MKRIKEFLKQTKEGKHTAIWLTICIVIFIALLAFTIGWNAITYCVIIVCFICFVIITFRTSFKALNRVQHTYNNLDLNKLKEYENIYGEFYRKYKYFFDRNTERNKKKINVKENIKTISIVITILCFACLKNDPDSAPPHVIICGLICGLIAWIIIRNDAKKESQEPVFDYNQVRCDFLSLINNTFVWRDNKQESIKQQYNKILMILGEEAVDYYSENHICGYLDGKEDMYFEMAEVVTTEKPYWAKNEELVSFKGVFVIVDSNKRIYNTITVTPNTYLDNVDDVKMDNAEFEKIFDIKCEDKILAMRIFTTEVLEKIFELHKKLKVKIEIIVDDNKVYLRFELFPLVDFTKNTLIEKDFLYNCERVKFVTQIIEIVAKAVNELEI